MNPDKLWIVAYAFPFVALAARFEQDSGDGDKDLQDFIDDRVQTWLPGAVVTKDFDRSKLDFVYCVEHGGEAMMVYLGTNGPLNGPGWKGDLSPGVETDDFGRLGGHVDFITTGEETARDFKNIICKYDQRFTVIAHSRGSRCLASVRWWLQNCGVSPAHVIPFCGPPVWNHAAAEWYDASGLGAVTIRPVMHHDLVDAAGVPFMMKHVGTELKLPHIHTKAIKEHGLVGLLGWGHAYSSIYECLIKYCADHAMPREVAWLKKTAEIATV